MSAAHWTLSDLARFVFRIPGMEWGFIQQDETLDSYKTAPQPGAPGVFQMGSKEITNFRVALRYDGKFVEVRGEHLEQTILAAFTALGLKLADKIAAAKSQDQATQRRVPTATDDEQAAYLKGLACDFRQAAETMQKLATHLEEATRLAAAA